MARRAYGAHRRMSAETVARNIVESIRRHRQAGIDREPTQYTQNAATIARVQALLANQE